MFTFALLGLLVASGVSTATYYLSSRYLLSQRERSAVRQAQADARLVRSVLRSPEPDVATLLASLDTPSEGRALVRFDGEWFANSSGVGPDLLPSELRQVVTDDQRPARQRYRGDGPLVLAVGLPLGGGDAYFEVFPLIELGRTLTTLSYSLLAAAAVSFVGSLAIGWWASRRVLRPVVEIGRAAAAIAAGRLDARLDVEGDAELFALASGFNAMFDSLRDRVERDARFASDVSHELRSPLTTLRSAVELMEARREELPPRSARALELLSEEVERFESLVTDLLEISRYDAGVAVLDLAPVDVTRLVRDVLASEAVENVEVACDDPGSAVQVVDRRRLEQTIRNLVRNAKRHGGGVACAGCSIGDDSFSIWIEDHGEGVPAEDREAIFQRFFRGSTAGRRSSSDGVGLGLALVHEQVRLHGGQAWVEDATPCGARFVVQLPTRRST
jgi:signal transduction histidine kinase